MNTTRILGAAAGCAAIVLVLGAGTCEPTVEEGVAVEVDAEGRSITVRNDDGDETTHDNLPEHFVSRVREGDTVEISDEEYGIEWERGD